MLLTLAFWRSIWRTFFIQASWNFERMQNLGFLYAILPILRQLYDGEELQDAARRHGQFFNTHPYFASTIVGSVAKLEEDAVRDKVAPDKNMNALRVGLMGSLGAVGDSLFWAALRPLAAWLAIFAALLGAPGTAIVMFFLVYNIPHLVVRFGGAAVGYAAGLDVVRQLRRVDFPQAAQRLKGAATAAAFCALPLLAWSVQGNRDLRSISVLAAAGLLWLIARGLSGTKLALGFLAVVVCGSWMWTLIE